MKVRWSRYLADPVGGVALAIYLLNRLLIVPHLLPRSAFCRGHLDDVLLIPCALLPLLLVYRCLALRPHDRPPTWPEILLHLAAWSLFFEWIGPTYLHRGTGDLWDVISYAAGAGIAGFIWNANAFRPGRAECAESKEDGTNRV